MYSLKTVCYHRKTLFVQVLRSYCTKKRKYPVYPEDAEKLPVFEYAVSKPSYRRIFVWGCVETGALGIPFIKSKKDLNHIAFIRRPRRLSFAEKHEVSSIASGLGFTLFGVNSDTNIKMYGTGLNSDSQIGYHAIRENKPLEIVFVPQPIHLPLKEPEKTNIIKIAAGRAHTLALTQEGLFTFGNNAFGQCGRKIISDEDYVHSRYIHLIRIVDGKKIKDIECGQDHSLIITKDGQVYACGWGADGQTGLGHFNSQSSFERVLGDISTENIVKVSSRSDFVLAINDKGDVFGWGNTEYGQLNTSNGAQQVCTPTFIKMCTKLGKIVDIAAGGSFCMALNDEGEVFVWGYGLLGAGPKVQFSKEPIKINSNLFGKNDFQPDNKVVKITSGISHAAAVTNYGDLYMWGRNRSYCLGLGDAKDQPFPLRVCLSGYVEDITCGFDHTVALCKPFI